MIPVHHGNIVRLWDESTPIAHIVGRGQRLLWRRRTGAISVQDAKNARREASYVAKRNGVKEPLLEIWRVK